MILYVVLEASPAWACSWRPCCPISRKDVEATRQPHCPVALRRTCWSKLRWAFSKRVLPLPQPEAGHGPAWKPGEMRMGRWQSLLLIARIGRLRLLRMHPDARKEDRNARSSFSPLQPAPIR